MWHTFAARVLLDGAEKDVIVKVTKTAQGQFHYNISRDMGDGARFMRTSVADRSQDYGLEDNPVELNIAFLPENFNGETKESRFTDAVKTRIDKLDIAPKGETERGILQRAITNAMGGNWNLLAMVPGNPLFTEHPDNNGAGRCASRIIFASLRQKRHQMTQIRSRSPCAVLKASQDPAGYPLRVPGSEGLVDAENGQYARRAADDCGGGCLHGQ